MDPKDKEQILKTIPAEWHERAHAFFQIASDQNVEWFPQGATTLEKKLISQNIIQQSEMIRLRVTNVFFFPFACNMTVLVDGDQETEPE